MNPLDEAALARLRDVMEKATPGEWAVHPIEARVDAFAGGSPLPVCKMLWPTEFRTEAETEANAVFIAAFNPVVARALLDMVERQRKALTEAEEILWPYIHSNRLSAIGRKMLGVVRAGRGAASEPSTEERA